METLVFVGGVPGAGKSTLCAQVGAGWTAFTAGKLIAQARSAKQGETYQRPTVASRSQADEFQVTLLTALSAISDTKVVLDGHFVVPTKSGPAQVPLWFFDEVLPNALLLVESPLEAVCSRLRERGAAWWDGSESTIATLIAQESDWAETVARHLGKFLHRIDGTGGVPAIWNPSMYFADSGC